MKVSIVYLILMSWSGILAEGAHYDFYQVHRVTPKTKEAAETLRTLEQTANDYDFWTSVRGVGRSVDIMVSPELKNQFNEMINTEAFDAEIFIPDVQKLIDNEQPKGIRPRVLEWNNYHTLVEINAFLEELANTRSEVELLEAGTSHEGRIIYGVKVSFEEGNENRTVFIESNIHAREWITSAVATWILNEILTSNDPYVRRIAESHDWIFVPVFNPDGFEFSHSEDVDERLWRKNRAPTFSCIGTDLNRNWGYHFGDGGASPNPCAENYRGLQAFSEESTNSLSLFIDSINPRLYAYIALHSYSQILLLPYGFSNAHLDNFDELLEVGKLAIAKLYERYQTNYTVGNIVDELYLASGGSMDWVKATYGTQITYTYELRDKGDSGFLLPANQIVPTAEETFDSLLTILEEFAKRNNPDGATTTSTTTTSTTTTSPTTTTPTTTTPTTTTPTTTTPTTTTPTTTTPTTTTPTTTTPTTTTPTTTTISTPPEIIDS